MLLISASILQCRAHNTQIAHLVFNGNDSFYSIKLHGNHSFSIVSPPLFLGHKLTDAKGVDRTPDPHLSPSVATALGEGAPVGDTGGGPSLSSGPDCAPAIN